MISEVFTNVANFINVNKVDCNGPYAILQPVPLIFLALSIILLAEILESII